jgi:hypothetical protein
MTRARSITKAIRVHDRNLYCILGEDGKHHIMQKPLYWPLMPHHVMSLTSNWGITGDPIDWGIEPILARLKAHNLASDGGQEFWDEIEESYEKADASKERDLKNSVESFLYEFKPQFAKATNDVNTSTLNKIDRRRQGDQKWA